MESKDLQKGDYFNIEFGFDRDEFYVLENHKEKELITVSKRDWLTSSYYTFSYQRLDGQMIYIGKGKKCWWRKFLIFNSIKEIVPIYKRPIK